MRTRAVAPPTGRELRACGLAALAEAGLVYLPAHMILSQSGSLGVGLGALAFPFLGLFVGGVLATCAFRTRPTTATVVGGVAVVLGLYLGRGDVNREVFAVVVMLLVAIRVATLGLRDWRDPIFASIGWGAAALAVETVIATGPQQDWRPLLLVIVPTFFLASLASRATIVWTTDLSGALSEEARAGWLRRALLLIGSLAGAMVAAVALGMRGGVLERLGDLVAPLMNALAVVLAFLMAQLARPVFWLIDRLNVDPRRIQSFFDSLQEHARNLDRSPVDVGGASLVQRILGLLAFGGLLLLLVTVIRRLRSNAQEFDEPREQPGIVTSAPIEVRGAPSPTRRARRHEPPDDVVRRWYAEILELLRRRNVPKEPSLTPAEFVPEVAAAFPGCAKGFAALTRAYEDVRYGHRTVASVRLSELREAHRSLTEVLSRAPQGLAAESPDG